MRFIPASAGNMVRPEPGWLVANPGFEAGQSAGWTASGSISVDRKEPRSGRYALRLDPGSRAEQTVERLFPHKEYTLRAWIKASSDRASLRLGVRDFGGAPVAVSTTNTGYTQLSVTFTMGPTPASAVVFVERPSAETGAAYVDDVELVPSGAVPAGPIVALAEIAGNKIAPGTLVTTERVRVESVDCPDCGNSLVPASFWIEDGAGTKIRVHWETAGSVNTKKQNWMPLVGWTVRVQGRVDLLEGVPYIEGIRWGENQHPGPRATIEEILAGRYPTGSYVWLAPSRATQKASNAGHWPDGDHTWNLTDVATGAGWIHIELPPAYQLGLPGLRRLEEGEVIEPYGFVWYEAPKGWWEIHPARCWNPGECVPETASFIDNSPAP